MTVEELVRSWKDPDHRTDAHPAGEIVLEWGGDSDFPLSALPGCNSVTIPWGGQWVLEEPAGDS